jgi:CRISPR-associated protein Cas2
MFIIAVYDVESKKDPKINKLFKQYLNWVQNSVFEGNIGIVDYREMLYKITKITSDFDSVIIYKFRNDKFMEREMIGKDKSNIWRNFI